ncbi:MAG: hypothetical protein R2909_03650 [Gemmatimonadales bacterium]
MGIFEMIFYLARAGILADVAVKLIRGHPAKEKELKQLRERVEEMDAKLTATMNELADAREMLDDETAVRAELAERLDFTERLLTRGTPPATDAQEELR